jgi:hypothetical protein
VSSFKQTYVPSCEGCGTTRPPLERVLIKTASMGNSVHALQQGRPPGTRWVYYCPNCREPERIVEHKVDQTDLSLITGNCWHASVATVLGVPLETLPVFTEEEERHHSWGWFWPWALWFAANDIGWAHYQFDDKTPNRLRLRHGQLVLLGGLSPRATPESQHHHSVVGIYEVRADGTEGFEYYHDPHPDRSYLQGLAQDIFILWREK